MTLLSLIRVGTLVFGSVTCIVVGDTAGKLLTGYGVEPIFIAWTRLALAALILLPLSGLSLKELPNFRDWRVLVRGVLITGGICGMLTALRTEPIADVFGAFFIGPIVSYALAVLFLGETPSRIRALLLAIGFAGVMLVVKPGFGGSWGIAFALAAGICYGGYLAVTRIVASDYRPRFLLLSQLMVGGLILTPAGLALDFPDFDVSITLLILLSAFASAVGNYLLVMANRLAEASLIAPLVYTQLISATVMGVFVFGDWPDNYALLGLILIAVSGFGSLFTTRTALSEKTQTMEQKNS